MTLPLLISTTSVWTAPPDAPEDYYAELPWAEGQAVLAAGAPLAGSAKIASCGWHGTRTDPNRGWFAVVAQAGPLADLLGERVRVTAAGRSLCALVVDSRDVAEDISLARPAFARLAVLSTEQLTVRVEVMVDVG